MTKAGLSLRDRFYLHVEKGDEGCWRWTAATDKYGRGRINNPSGSASAPVVAWELEHGRRPAGMVVAHTCDNPNCVNPEHLKLMTQHDNIRDSVKKGRMHRGVRTATSRLTEDQVREVKQDTTFNNAEWARRLGVSSTCIRFIRTGRTWRHVHG